MEKREGPRGKISNSGRVLDTPSKKPKHSKIEIVDITVFNEEDIDEVDIGSRNKDNSTNYQQQEQDSGIEVKDVVEAITRQPDSSEPHKSGCGWSKKKNAVEYPSPSTFNPSKSNPFYRRLQSRRKEKGIIKYLVRWNGYGPEYEYDYWYRRDDLDNAQDIPEARRNGPRDFIMSMVNAVNPDGSRKYHLDIQLPGPQLRFTAPAGGQFWVGPIWDDGCRGTIAYLDGSRVRTVHMLHGSSISMYHVWTDHIRIVVGGSIMVLPPSLAPNPMVIPLSCYNGDLGAFFFVFRT
ncbi:hypothetical protein T310_7818 [Rasamsonia emersonii CBS 393.64]|uniref:Chromo domain-containing protein n=1 Tax=Rasamsonia emersonii (strain ATCC 16479 / CBS 393.64 / IMI 116815) TaxID=1408163 RepID=A0A0F4YIZ2_RASE3|nr:hypothetical protein T310_7818 [Rasamsonia emersonii CBS 393.64]KKA18242.1 hypothetical protein T310_7818 [Rasamsonia emersonii CBS 393.64]